jgi:hypothetical protein
LEADWRPIRGRSAVNQGSIKGQPRGCGRLVSTGVQEGILVAAEPLHPEDYRGCKGPCGATKSHKGPQGVTRGHNGPKGATRGHKGPQGATRGYKGPQEATRGHKGPQGNVRGSKGLREVMSSSGWPLQAMWGRSHI